jgi:hypothetical protein
VLHCSIEWATNTEYVKKFDLKKLTQKYQREYYQERRNIIFYVPTCFNYFLQKYTKKKKRKEKTRSAAPLFFLYWLCLLLAMCHLLLRRSSFAIV